MRILPVFTALLALAAPLAHADDSELTSSADFDGQTIKCDVYNMHEQAVQVLSITYSWTCEDPYTGFYTNHSENIPCDEGLFCKVAGTDDHEFNGLYRESLCNVTQVTCEAHTITLNQ